MRKLRVDAHVVCSARRLDILSLVNHIPANDSFDSAAVLAEVDAQIATLRDPTDSAEREALSEALLHRAYLLQGFRSDDEALSAYRAVADRFGLAHEDAVRRNVGRALLQQANLFDELDRKEEAELARQRAAELAQDMVRPTVDEMNRDVQAARDLIKAGRLDEAVVALIDVINPWGRTPPPEVAPVVCYASVLFAQTALATGPNTDATLESCAQTMQRYGHSDDPEVRSSVAWSFLVKARAFGMSGDHEKAVVACSEALAYLGDAREPVLRERIAAALYTRGQWLAKTGDYLGARADYDSVITRFEASRDPLTEGHVKAARSARSALSD